MAIYVIGYDLNRQGQNYADLQEAIKSYGTYMRPLDSTWFIRTSHSAVQIRDHLQQFIDGNDELFVGELTGVAAWTGLTDDQNKWITDVFNNKNR